jgi:hypothetical protein
MALILFPVCCFSQLGACQLGRHSIGSVAETSVVCCPQLSDHSGAVFFN